VVHISNRRSIRAETRRSGIMRAAARVFRARGFAAAGMREIAVAADLSPGNLYHYFRGKDEILFYCQDRSLARLLEALAEARRHRRQPLADRLHALAVAHVLCLVDEVEGSAAHLTVDALPPRLRARIVAKRDRYERGVRALVADGIKGRALRATDATVATRAFLGALNWTAHWFRPEGQQSRQEIARLVADYAVTGLGAIDSRKSSVSSRKSSVSSRKSPVASRSRQFATQRPPTRLAAARQLTTETDGLKTND
jgi:AcrR family transcriptional regulator